MYVYNSETIKKFESEVANLDEKICDERRKLKNGSWNSSVFALRQWEKQREHYMTLLREAIQ